MIHRIMPAFSIVCSPWSLMIVVCPERERKRAVDPCSLKIRCEGLQLSQRVVCRILRAAAEAFSKPGHKISDRFVIAMIRLTYSQTSGGSLWLYTGCSPLHKKS